MFSEEDIISFVAFLPPSHSLWGYSEGVFHHDCYRAWDKHEIFDELHKRFKEAIAKRPMNLKTVEEMDAWTLPDGLYDDLQAPVNFCKFEGFGNDYIVIAADELRGYFSVGDFAKKICNRTFGAGSDGIAVWEKLENGEADFSVRIINPDGSEGSFSGNGTRCAVAYFYYKKIWHEQSLRLSTLSGIKTYNLLEEIAPGHYWFDAEIGQPKFAARDIPFVSDKGEDPVSDFPLDTSLGKINITVVNPGNPVCVIFVDEFGSQDWRKLGAELESHPAFPERTNVVFVKTVDRENIEVRIWERGAAETSSSGTCSAAAAVASAFTGKTGRKVFVHAPGGTTTVTWREDGEMLLNGRADLVFCGKYNFRP